MSFRFEFVGVGGGPVFALAISKYACSFKLPVKVKDKRSFNLAPLKRVS